MTHAAGPVELPVARHDLDIRKARTHGLGGSVAGPVVDDDMGKRDAGRQILRMQIRKDGERAIAAIVTGGQRDDMHMSARSGS